MNHLPNSRLRLIMILSVVGFALVIGRAIKIQTIDARELVRRADAQQRHVYDIPVPRGTITDRNGNQLAQQVTWKTLMAYPKQVVDANVTAAYIADRLGIKGRKDRRAEITRLRGLLESDAYQVQLVRQLDPATVDDILSAHPPGLFAVPEAHRVYPFRNLAAQLLGYTDIDLHGRPNGSGLEYTLNPWLAGKPGRELEVNAPDGQPLEKLQLAQPQDGRNVQLTIDQVVQAKVQGVLEDTVRQWKAKSATAIVLDPRTGEVLAMGTAPSYDNNKVHDLSPWQLHQLTRNRAVQDMYEPGSTFKVVTFAAALSAGIIYPQMKFRSAVRDPGRRPQDPRRRVPRADHADGVADPPAVVERRHRRDRPPGRAAPAVQVDREVRVRQANRAGPLSGAGRLGAAGRRLVRLVDRQHPDRPGHQRHADADGGPVQHHRQ